MAYHCNQNCRQGRDCPNRIYIRGIPVPMWLMVVFLLVLFGAVGHMGFVDSVREEYQGKCIAGEVNVEGDLVTCTKENQQPLIIGVLK